MTIEPLPTIVPVFPLPGVVLFPDAILPLHIFEPRYRAMVRDAIDGNQLIAMALLKDGSETDVAGKSEVYPVGCVGRIEKVQALPDGRFNIALAGLCRVRFEEFILDQPYRQARIAPIPEAPSDESYRASTEREEDELRLLAAFGSLHRALQGLGPGESGMPLAVNPGVPFEILVNSLCLHAEVGAADKQRLLEMPGARERCRALTMLLDRRLQQGIARGEIETPPPAGPVN